MLSASGGLRPPDQGLCPWTSPRAPPPDPGYRLALRARHLAHPKLKFWIGQCRRGGGHVPYRLSSADWWKLHCPGWSKLYCRVELTYRYETSAAATDTRSAPMNSTPASSSQWRCRPSRSIFQTQEQVLCAMNETHTQRELEL